MPVIPYRSLSKQALENVIDEFISREGNILDGSMKTKRQQVLAVLKRRDALISYDEISKTTQIHTKDELTQRMRQGDH